MAVKTHAEIGLLSDIYTDCGWRWLPLLHTFMKSVVPRKRE